MASALSEDVKAAETGNKPGRIARYWKKAKDQWLDINPIYLFFACLVSAATTFGIMMLRDDGGGNVLPELFGFFMDGAIFVFFIGHMQHYQTLKQRERVKNHVLTILSNLSPELISTRQSGNKFHITFEVSKEINDNSSYCDSLDKVLTPLHSDILKELLPLTATFSSKHLSLWAEMMTNLNEAKSAKADKALMITHGKNFIRDLQAFINAKVYV